MIAIVIASLETGRGRIERSQGGVIVVGGDPRCDVVLGGRGVSGSHCRLSPMPELPGAFLLEDLASTYGTFVNSARIGRPVVVSGTDVISVGDAMLMLAQPGQEQAAIQRLSELAAPSREKEPKAAAAKAPVAAFDPRAPWMQQFEHFDALARSWHDSGRPTSKLLEGATVALAERWLEAGKTQSPAPGALHRDFIERSRNRRAFRLQILVAAVVVGVLVVGGGVAAFFYWSEIESLLVPPQATVVVTEDADDDASVVATPVELPALIDAVAVEPEPERRLLLQTAVAEVARSQGKPLLSDDVWALLRSANETLGERRETVLRGHAARVTDVAFSPDGLKMASASEDGSARLWDFSVPAPGGGSALRGHIGAAHVVAFSPDGTRLATGGDDGKVYLWRLDAPEPATTGVALAGHESSVRVVTWHPDGKRLASGDDAGTIALWSADAPEAPLSSRAAHEGPITALVFDHGETPTLWSGADDRLARRWSLREDGGLAKLRTLDEHEGGVTAVAVSDDDRWAATATTSGEVMLWPLWTPRKRGRGKGSAALPPIPLEGNQDAVAAVAFTPDGRWLVSGGGGGVRMWNIQVKDPSDSSILMPGHTGDITDMALAAGNRAVTSATDNRVRVWDLEKSQKVLVAEDFEGHRDAVRAVAVSPDGLRIVSGGDDHTVRVWDAFDRSPGRGASVLRVGPSAVQDYAVTESGLVLGVSTDTAKIWALPDRGRWRVPRVLEGGRGSFSAGAFDTAGEHAAVGTETGQIYVWTLAEAAPVVLEGHAGTINGLAFLPDGRLVSVSSDRSVMLWELDAPQTPTTWNAHGDEVHAVVAAQSGEFVFTGGLDGSLVRWTVADGTALSMPGHEGEVLQLRLSPDGTRLASASADRRARVWDVASGKPELVLRGHDEAVRAVAFGRRRWLATGGADAKILVWDLTSEHPDESPRALVGHEQSVTALSFTRDPEVLASGSNDETVRLWRLDADRQLVLPGHDGVVTGLTLAEDGSLLVSAGFDGTLRAWPLAHTAFTRLVCDVVGESLPPGDAARALGVPVDDPCADASATGRR